MNNSRRYQEVMLNELNGGVNGNGCDTLPEEYSTCRRILKPLTDGQADYMDAIDNSRVTICSGVAGTGKSYIAVGKAVELFLDKKVKKIILCRPAIECGKGLGFLPGEMDSKIAPYMRPLLDALHDFMHPKEVNKCIENESIELCALEYMRGRNIRNSVIILDEGQNADIKQWRMFLTRISFGSKIIAVGDMSQSDLEKIKSEAFAYVCKQFDTPPYVEPIKVVQLGREDIVRDEIIKQIIAKIGE